MLLLPVFFFFFFLLLLLLLYSFYPCPHFSHLILSHLSSPLLYSLSSHLILSHHITSHHSVASRIRACWPFRGNNAIYHLRYFFCLLRLGYQRLGIVCLHVFYIQIHIFMFVCIHISILLQLIKIIFYLSWSLSHSSRISFLFLNFLIPYSLFPLSYLFRSLVDLSIFIRSTPYLHFQWR